LTFDIVLIVKIKRYLPGFGCLAALSKHPCSTKSQVVQACLKCQ